MIRNEQIKAFAAAKVARAESHERVAASPRTTEADRANLLRWAAGYRRIVARVLAEVTP